VEQAERIGAASRPMGHGRYYNADSKPVRSAGRDISSEKAPSCGLPSRCGSDSGVAAQAAASVAQRKPDEQDHCYAPGESRRVCEKSIIQQRQVSAAKPLHSSSDLAVRPTLGAQSARSGSPPAG